MKKCLIGFIVVLTSLFSFKLSVNAYEFSYNNINFDTDEILLKIKNKYSSIDFENKYRFHFSYILDNKIYFVTHDAPDMYNLNFQSISNKEDIKPYDNEVIIAPGGSSNGYTWNAWHYVYYYTYDLSTGEEIISSSYGSSPSSRVRFANNNEKLDSESYEEFIERKVLYSNMNFSLVSAMIDENYYRPYDIESVESEVTYRKQFNNDVSPNLKEISFDFPYLGLSNGNIIKTRIEYGTFSNIVDDIPLYESLKIYGYDLDGNIYDFSNYISYDYLFTDYLSSHQIDLEFYLNEDNVSSIPSDILRIKVYFDFETYNNNYYFNVFDSFIEGTTTWEYIKDNDIKPNSFSDIVSTSIYSQVEFDFTIPTSSFICTNESFEDGLFVTEEYICPILDIDYEIFNSDILGNVNTLSFGIPYIEKKYLEDTGSSSIEKTEIITLSEYISSFYEGNKVIDFDSNITSLKLIVPLDYLIGSYVNIYFSANTTFDVNLIERSSSSNYYGSVDITGKAGVLFVPKNVNNDFLATFNFNPSSIYGLQLRDTYESNFNILAYYSIGYCDYREYDSTIPIICNEGQGGYTVSFNFERDNVKQSIFVLNKNFPEETKAIVQYDTRYFVPVVYDELWSRPSFEHPITGETVTSDDLIDFDEALNDQDYENFFDMFIDSFNYFKDSLVGIFDNVTYFFNSLPVALKYFFMLIFTIILFIFLIRFIL